VKIAPLSAIHTLVTDDSLPIEALTKIGATGVEVITPRRMAAQAVIG
jgi:DeoR/GlpR family transcriptional regulator of sugar metabolism